MIKKLSLLCGGLATAGFLAAIGLADQKAQPSVPPAAEKSATEAPRLVRLGASKTIPNRAPEGGYTAPVTFAPTPAQFAECTIIDGNNDGKTWSLDGEYLKYTYNYSQQADDWCILPPMNLEGGTYKVTYTYKTRSDMEDFKLCIGSSTDPASMTTTIMEKTSYTNQEDVTESRTVDIPSDGTWHFGLYASSPANKFYIFFKNISIEKLSLGRRLRSRPSASIAPSPSPSRHRPSEVTRFRPHPSRRPYSSTATKSRMAHSPARPANHGSSTSMSPQAAPTPSQPPLPSGSFPPNRHRSSESSPSLSRHSFPWATLSCPTQTSLNGVR